MVLEDEAKSFRIEEANSIFHHKNNVSPYFIYYI